VEFSGIKQEIEKLIMILVLLDGERKMELNSGGLEIHGELIGVLEVSLN